jgi:CheY-like chemotaxis protein
MIRSAGRVLVAEDDRVLQRIIATYLTANGYNVKYESPGPDALHPIPGWTPDLVLLDVSAAELDCTAARLQEPRSFGTAGIPIVLLSTAPSVAGLRDDPAVAGVLLKPFALSTLLVLVRALVPATRRSPEIDCLQAV